MANYKIEGKNYQDAIVSDDLIAIARALNKGASIDVNFHNLDSYEEVIERMDIFKTLESEGTSFIIDRIDECGSIIFNKGYKNVDVSAYLKAKKVTPPASNE